VALPVWLNNLIAYSLQIAILAAMGTLLAYLFRLRLPRVALLYWQVLLLVSITLPFLQSWKHPVISQAIPAGTTASPGIFSGAIPASVNSSRHIPWEMLAPILAAGICLRLAWLMIGFLRLSFFQRKSHMFIEEHAAVRDMEWRTGVRVSLLLSSKVDSPVTYGIRPPKVILPLLFKDLSEPCQKAILCHELLHVRRCDWILIIAEEIACSLFWFHPAVWWLRNRIQLSREQAIDFEVVQLTGSKKPYLDSLLEFAQAQARPREVPAPLFLKERHLVNRVTLLLKELPMSRSRLAASILSISALLVITMRFALGWFPLTGEPVRIQTTNRNSQNGSISSAMLVSSPGQFVNSEIQIPRWPAIRIDGKFQEQMLIHKVNPIYPEEAKLAGIEGKVIYEVTINEEGSVFSIQTLSVNTDEILEQAAVAAVKQWKYSPTILDGKAVPVRTIVTVVFKLKDIDDLAVSMDESGNLSGELSQILKTKGTLEIAITAATPFPVVERVVRELNQNGIQKIKLLPPYVLYQGRVFFEGTPANAERLMPLVDSALLVSMARASGQFEPGKPCRLIYRLYLSETGEALGIQQIAGARVPEIEDELMRTNKTPARRGSVVVPFVCPVGLYFIG
jgi:TonB family protein